jgi:hypothetical protein
MRYQDWFQPPEPSNPTIIIITIIIRESSLQDSQDWNSGMFPDRAIASASLSRRKRVPHFRMVELLSSTTRFLGVVGPADTIRILRIVFSRDLPNKGEGGFAQGMKVKVASSPRP